MINGNNGPFKIRNTIEADYLNENKENRVAGCNDQR